MVRRILVASSAVAFIVLAAALPAAAAAVPSGERTLGPATVEPFYNAEQAGQIGFLLAPSKAKGFNADQVDAWAPIYLPVYPVGSTAAPDGLICTHTPIENCPTHGDAVAAAAMALEPGVYGAGVLGHDHVMDFPGGDEFHIAWEPILVLFTDDTRSTHLCSPTRRSRTPSPAATR